MLAAMNRYIAENADNTADWYYWTVNAGKAWLTNDMSKVENFLSLKLNGGSFNVTPYGKNAGNGTIIVALYDSENMNKLLDVKTFDLAKGEVPQDEFTQSGYVKAFWWSSLDNMVPLCSAEEDMYNYIPTPGGDDSGYTSDDYGGGDSGGGIEDFSGGGSSYVGPDSLPQPTGAQLIFDSSNVPLGVDIIENVTLKEDGTVNTTNESYLNDTVLAKAVSEASETLKKDCGFNKQLCLAVLNRSYFQKSVKIKLNSTYKNKKAYIFCYDKNGNLVNSQSGIKYITKILYPPFFDNDTLFMDLDPLTTVILGFGI